MGERYLITGVQLGILKAYIKEHDTYEKSIGGKDNGEALINEILENQFVCESNQDIEDDVQTVREWLDDIEDTFGRD